MKSLRLGACTAGLAALLAACGGGGGDGGTSAPARCSVADQKSWLGGYMGDWYFWYSLSPRPDASAYTTVATYFEALLYTGTSATFPSDRCTRGGSSVA